MNEDKASRFHRRRRWAQAGAAAAGLALLAVWVASGASASVRTFARAAAQAAAAPDPWASAVEVGVCTLVLVVALSLAECPFELYRSFLLERRYGLTSETLSTWLGDQARSVAIGAAVALVAAQIAYAALRWSPAWWWILTGLTFTVGLVALGIVAPVLLLPLFYRVGPLARQDLAERLVGLSRRAGVPVVGIYEWGLGAKSRRANAALTGFGPTRRILLSDTLLEGYSDDEVEVIVAHELSHHVHRDLWRMVALDGAVLTAGLWLGHVALRLVGPGVGLETPHDAAGLPILVLAGGVVALLATPWLNARSREGERRADRFALDLTGDASAFLSAMRRLGAQNLAEEQPSRIVEWWFYSHPPLSDRLEAARRWHRDGREAEPAAAGSRGA